MIDAGSRTLQSGSREAGALPRRRRRLTSLIALVGALGACADFEGTTDSSRGLPDIAVASPSFSTDVQPIFTRTCAMGGCHSLTTRQAGLVLTEGAAYDAIVGKTALTRPQLQLVRAGQPDASWLALVIGPDETARSSISRMPLASPALTPNQVATIRNWIARGAPRN